MFASSQRRPYYHPAYRAAVTRVVDPKAAARIMGSGLQCRGIHLPPDPSPRTLPADVRRFWDTVVRNAGSYYKDQQLAEVTAWKTVRMFFGPNGARSSALDQQHRPHSPLGDPGDLAQLGVLVEYTFLDARAQLQIRKFPKNDAPFLFWSQSLRTCYAFPGAELGACQVPDLHSSASTAYKTWTQRQPKCERDVDVPETSIVLDGFCDTIVYASDKWHEPDPSIRMTASGEYIHQVGDGVGLWQAPGKVPLAIAVTGGCFDMEARGLIH